MTLHSSVAVYRDELTGIRRTLHRIPEVGYEEKDTQSFILDFFSRLKADRVDKLADTGVKAVFYGKNPRRTVAFRADMDGLSVREENTHGFVSCREGMMHACGHDGHMAILLGLASLLNQYKEELQDHVVLLFQPAEESVGGARRMMEEGALKDPKVDMIYGLHIMPDIPQGKIGLRDGPIMAQTCEFDITIQGKSAHGAMPHRGIDAIVAGAYFINLLQTVVTRSIDPYQKGLVTIGKMYGGERRNIIAEHVTLEGMIRTFSDDVYGIIKNRILEILEGLEKSFHVRTQYHELTFYPVVDNHPHTTASLADAVGKDHVVEVQPMMIAEDFSFFQKEVPGTYFFLGSGNTQKGFINPLHSNRFDFDEEILLYGMEIYRRILNIG